MRNEWKVMRWATLAAFSTCVSLPSVAAQGAQSADGAQQFLATMAKKVMTRVSFIDASGRNNYVTGKFTGEVKTTKGSIFGTKEIVEAVPEQVVEKQVADVRASVLEAIDAYGRPTACATRLTEVVAPSYDDSSSDTTNDNHSFSFKVTTTSVQRKYEPLTKFMSPAQVIDWSNVKINRSPEGAITVTSKGQSFAWLQLTYVAGGPDLADRIEYAMKFLAMSCDSTASTGF